MPHQPKTQQQQQQQPPPPPPKTPTPTDPSNTAIIAPHDHKQSVSSTTLQLPLIDQVMSPLSTQGDEKDRQILIEKVEKGDKNDKKEKTLVEKLETINTSHATFQIYMPVFTPFRPHFHNAFATMIDSDLMYIVTSSTLILISTMYELAYKDSRHGKKTPYLKSPKLYVLTAEMVPRKDLLEKPTSTMSPLPAWAPYISPCVGWSEKQQQKFITHHNIQNAVIVPNHLSSQDQVTTEHTMPHNITNTPTHAVGQQGIVKNVLTQSNSPLYHKSLLTHQAIPDPPILTAQHQLYIPSISLRVYQTHPTSSTQWKNPQEVIKINPPAFLMKPSHLTQHQFLSDLTSVQSTSQLQQQPSVSVGGVNGGLVQTGLNKQSLQSSQSSQTTSSSHTTIPPQNIITPQTTDENTNRIESLIWYQDLQPPPLIGNPIPPPEPQRTFFSFQLPLLTPTTTNPANPTPNKDGGVSVPLSPAHGAQGAPAQQQNQQNQQNQPNQQNQQQSLTPLSITPVDINSNQLGQNGGSVTPLPALSLNSVQNNSQNAPNNTISALNSATLSNPPTPTIQANISTISVAGTGVNDDMRSTNGNNSPLPGLNEDKNGPNDQNESPKQQDVDDSQLNTRQGSIITSLDDFFEMGSSSKNNQNGQNSTQTGPNSTSTPQNGSNSTSSAANQTLDTNPPNLVLNLTTQNKAHIGTNTQPTTIVPPPPHSSLSQTLTPVQQTPVKEKKQDFFSSTWSAFTKSMQPLTKPAPVSTPAPAAPQPIVVHRYLSTTNPSTARTWVSIFDWLCSGVNDHLANYNLAARARKNGGKNGENAIVYPSPINFLSLPVLNEPLLNIYPFPPPQIVPSLTTFEEKVEGPGDEGNGDVNDKKDNEKMDKNEQNVEVSSLKLDLYSNLPLSPTDSALILDEKKYNNDEKVAQTPKSDIFVEKSEEKGQKGDKNVQKGQHTRSNSQTKITTVMTTHNTPTNQQVIANNDDKNRNRSLSNDLENEIVGLHTNNNNNNDDLNNKKKDNEEKSEKTEKTEKTEKIEKTILNDKKSDKSDNSDKSLLQDSLSLLSTDDQLSVPAVLLTPNDLKSPKSPTNSELMTNAMIQQVFLYNNHGSCIRLNRSIDYTALFPPTFQITYAACGETVPIFSDAVAEERFLIEVNNQLKLAQPVTPITITKKLSLELSKDGGKVTEGSILAESGSNVAIGGTADLSSFGSHSLPKDVSTPTSTPITTTGTGINVNNVGAVGINVQGSGDKVTGSNAVGNGNNNNSNLNNGSNNTTNDVSNNNTTANNPSSGSEINNWFKKTFTWGGGSTKTTDKVVESDKINTKEEKDKNQSTETSTETSPESPNQVISVPVGDQTDANDTSKPVNSIAPPFNMVYQPITGVVLPPPTLNHYLGLEKLKTNPPFQHHPPVHPMNLMKESTLPLSLKEFYYLCVDNTAPLSMNAFHTSLPEQFFQLKTSDWSLCTPSIAVNQVGSESNTHERLGDKSYQLNVIQKVREEAQNLPSKGNLTKATGHIVPPLNYPLTTATAVGSYTTPKPIEWDLNKPFDNLDLLISVHGPGMSDSSLKSPKEIMNSCKDTGYQPIWKQYLFRTMTMKSRVSTPTGIVETRLFKTQRLALFYALVEISNEDGTTATRPDVVGLELETTSSTPDVTMGDSFVVVDSLLCFSGRINNNNQQNQQNELPYGVYPTSELIVRSNVKFTQSGWSLKPFMGIISSRSKSDNQAVVVQYFNFLTKNIELVKQVPTNDDNDGNGGVIERINKEMMWPPICYQEIPFTPATITSTTTATSIQQASSLQQLIGTTNSQSNNDNQVNNGDNNDNEDEENDQDKKNQEKEEEYNHILNKTLQLIQLPPQLHPILIIPICIVVLPILSLISGNGFGIPSNLTMFIIMGMLFLQLAHVQRELLTVKRENNMTKMMLKNIIEKQSTQLQLLQSLSASTYQKPSANKK